MTSRSRSSSMSSAPKLTTGPAAAGHPPREAHLAAAEMGDALAGGRTLRGTTRRVEEIASDAALDAGLVQEALRGDQLAFAELVARYQRKGFWIAYHTLGRVEEARDVVQEAFLRVYRSLAKFDFDRNFYTWFYRIVMNLAIDALRKVKQSRASVIEDMAESFAAPDDHMAPLERSETRGLVWQVLDHLDDKFRSVLVLRDLQGLSCREIAPILKVTHATVRWRLHRGRKLFRERWERVARQWC